MGGTIFVNCPLTVKLSKYEKTTFMWSVVDQPQIAVHDFQHESYQIEIIQFNLFFHLGFLRPYGPSARRGGTVLTGTYLIFVT